MRKFLKQSKPYLLAVGAALVCLACFFVVWFHYLRGCETKSQSIYLNDSYDVQTAPLMEGKPTSQQFTTTSAVYGIGIVFQRLVPEVSGTVHIHMSDAETGETVLDADGKIAEVIYDSYTGFLLDVPVTQASEHTWLLTVTPTYTKEPNQLALAKSSVPAAGFGVLSENGLTAEGSLAMLTTVEQLGNLPVKGYWALAFVCAALSAVLALLCQWKRPGKAALTFCAVLALGLCYQAVLPAYSAPDEVIHFHTAYVVSNNWLGIAPSDPENNFIQRTCDDDEIFSDYKTTPYTYRYMMQHLFDGAPAQTTYVESREYLMGSYRIPYYISAAGITLARLLHFGGVGTAVFGRLMNLLFFAAMAAAAVYLTPVAKGMFAVFAMLPGCLHLAGSYSYDSGLLALCMVIVALCLRCALQEGSITIKEILALYVLCFFLAPLKFIYIPMCLLVFIIPAANYANRRSRLAARIGSIGAAGINFTIFNWLTVYQIVRFSIMFMGEIGADRAASTSFGMLSPLFRTSGAAVATVINPRATYSLFYLAAHPGILLRLVCNTFFPNIESYAAGFLGGELGYRILSEINISGLILVGFLLLMLIGCLPQEGETRLLKRWQRRVLILVFFVVFAMVGLACIYWTPTDYDYLWGFQGRYLLPLLPCLLAAIPFGRVRTNGDSFHAVLFGGFTLGILSILNILSVVYLR